MPLALVSSRPPVIITSSMSQREPNADQSAVNGKLSSSLLTAAIQRAADGSRDADVPLSVLLVCADCDAAAADRERAGAEGADARA